MTIIGFTSEFCPVCGKRTVFIFALAKTDEGRVKMKFCKECWEQHVKDMIKE